MPVLVGLNKYNLFAIYPKTCSSIVAIKFASHDKSCFPHTLLLLLCEITIILFVICKSIYRSLIQSTWKSTKLFKYTNKILTSASWFRNRFFTEIHWWKCHTILHTKIHRTSHHIFATYARDVLKPSAKEPELLEILTIKKPELL